MADKDPDGRFEGKALWGIAFWQRVLRVYMAVYLLAILMVFVGGIVGVNAATFLVVICVGAPVVMAPLAFKMHSPLMAWAMVLFGCGFVVGWAVMAVLNLQATAVLRRHGIGVGFWGAERNGVVGWGAGGLFAGA
jgi:hypothetical protein